MRRRRRRAAFSSSGLHLGFLVLLMAATLTIFMAIGRSIRVESSHADNEAGLTRVRSESIVDNNDYGTIELDKERNQLRWINSASCPGSGFGRDKCTRDIRDRDIADNCMVFGCDVKHLNDKWIVLVGDSNMRYLYFSIMQKTTFASELRGGPDEQYRDREAMNKNLRLRFSFRFMDARKLTEVGDDTTTETKMDRIIAEMGQPRSENGTLLAKPPGQYHQPDLVIMNTGLWELMAIGEEDWQASKLKLQIQFRALLKRWRSESISKRLVWMTSPSVRPRDKLRQRLMNKSRMRWLAAMETKMILEDFPEVTLIENWAWTEKEGFQDSEYHYLNCSMATERKLVMGTMCRQMGLPSTWDGEPKKL